MEELLHYVWKHKLFPLKALTTTAGLPVEVIDPGLHNTNAGPDFFNAKIRIGGTLWVGNIEIHDHAADWYTHGHHRDGRYDNVVLHVVRIADDEARTANGQCPPQLQIEVPQGIRERYSQLAHADRYPPCYQVIPSLSTLTVHSWTSALQAERLGMKSQAIGDRLKRCDGSWEAAYFVTLARNYGFGINGDAFESWAYGVPLHQVDHHRDNLFQIEAIFLGQAGLLCPEAIPNRHRHQALADDYYNRLRQEYQYLSHKFGLQPMDYQQWRFLRLRPQNFPHIRLSQLARLYYERRAGLSQLLECTTVSQLREALATAVTPYWQTHYTFGAECASNAKHLSASSVNLLLINTVIPLFFAYGQYHGNEALCDRAFSLLEALGPENNHIVRLWRECGLSADHAGDSQALIHLKSQYCDRHDCLRCRFGYEYLRQR